MNGILGNFLKDVQNSNGRVGTKYVNEATGELNSAINDARTAINKATSVITEFLAKVKGWIKKKIQEGIEALVKAVLAPEPTGNVLTPVTEFLTTYSKILGVRWKILVNVLLSG